MKPQPGNSLTKCMLSAISGFSPSGKHKCLNWKIILFWCFQLHSVTSTTLTNAFYLWQISNFLIEELSKESSAYETVSCNLMRKWGRENVFNLKVLLNFNMDLWATSLCAFNASTLRNVSLHVLQVLLLLCLLKMCSFNLLFPAQDLPQKLHITGAGLAYF